MRDRLLDAAQEAFAGRGYDASPLKEIASEVGIGASAIYKHCRNKMALYEAVIERLAAHFLAMLEEFDPDVNSIEFSNAHFQYHVKHPALARIALHATLAGGEQRRIMVEKVFKPFFLHCNRKMRSSHIVSARELARNPAHFMAFNSLIIGYVNLAALHREALGLEPLAARAVQDEAGVVEKFAWSLTRDFEADFVRYMARERAARRSLRSRAPSGSARNRKRSAV
jgi:AcrR family transcriptional regulator